MNITDRLAEALLDRRECARCGQDEVVVSVIVMHRVGRVSESYLCRACHSDLAWFMSTPPEQPSTSSDMVSATKESNNATTT